MKFYSCFPTRTLILTTFIVGGILVLSSCGENDAFIAKSMETTKNQRVAIENRITPFSVVNVEGGMERDVVPALPGEAKYAACGACHGANGSGGVGPALAGQTIEYIVNRLNSYRNGEKVGSQSNMMWGQAAGLSDTDINDLATYVNSL